MSDIPALALALLAGALLGVLFFAGLWWTVQKGVRSQNPALWFLTRRPALRLSPDQPVFWRCGFFMLNRGLNWCPGHKRRTIVSLA